ncbi:MAG: acyl carrier protein [Coprobacter sp.]|uniref:acyl carrier protein n=1 Tax=Barnesiella propionica TaxID=2981781 RepID=UPI000D79612D|nr:acyl carrier protein [Barnesiella propionica]MBO1734926.1 acyl carrier protein [Barnesiella sp. GGCC_0306]MBS7039332.1 acyl carrier protein [Bacteroidales bacterium]MCU6769565.1 acyl carrier protein [Barnesiella propionica]PWM89716.1 MAG: acyl carrier protein [Coprobacter sp.]
MEERHFLDLIASMMYKTRKENLRPFTCYKELSEWNAVLAVSLSLMIQEEYRVQVTDEDFRQTDTIQDLFFRVKSRKKS